MVWFFQQFAHSIAVRFGKQEKNEIIWYNKKRNLIFTSHTFDVWKVKKSKGKCFQFFTAVLSHFPLTERLRMCQWKCELSALCRCCSEHKPYSKQKSTLQWVTFGGRTSTAVCRSENLRVGERILISVRTSDPSIGCKSTCWLCLHSPFCRESRVSLFH